MKNILYIKYFIIELSEYIIIFLFSIIFALIISTKTIAEENIFIIDNVKVKGAIDLNFTRDKYLNKAFLNSFEILIKKILLSKDLKKISNINLKEIKELISSFKIIEESYRRDEYKAIVQISYNELKVKKFLSKKNTSFSQPENISAIFFPVFFIYNEIQNFSDNFFYKNWENVKIENKLINFILPLDDIEDISKIVEMKDRIEELEVNSLVNKNDVKNYVFALIDYQNPKLNLHLKTQFNNSRISKNMVYELNNVNDEVALNSILKDIKIKITDLWKEENLINLLMPLSIQIKFEHKKLKDFDKLRKTFYKINIIDTHVIEEFNINNSFFKIYYFGNPKKLKSELLKFGYDLRNNQGYWQLYLNE